MTRNLGKSKEIVEALLDSLRRYGSKISTLQILSWYYYFKINCKTCSLILSDFRMPGMNGYELVKQAKQIDSDAKVVLMTAFGIQDKEFHNMLPDIKVDGFLEKPFTLENLNEVVEGIILRH